MDTVRLAEELRRDEGLRLKPYRDTVGKLTLGYGRNLDDRGITRAEAEILLMGDIAATIAAVEQALPWFPRLDGVRQRVLVNMAFNLGTAGLLKFRRMLAACEHGRYDEAADEMQASVWAQQVPTRAARLIAMMRTGEVR